MSRQIAENPFYVLGLRPDCAAHAVETEGQKLLAMLELGLESAASYATPLGRRPRDAAGVRRAMAELRDPRRRLVHEVWARLEPPDDPTEAEISDDPLAPWPDALSLFGR